MNLCLQTNVNLEEVQIRDKGGYNNLVDTLDVEIKGSGLQHLGVLVDADDDLGRRWQSLLHRLSSVGYSRLPVAPSVDGTIIREDGLPVLGLWIMPNNSVSGILEDFVRYLVPSGDTLWERAATCVDMIPDSERRFPEVRRSKARLHTWLAWQEEPGKPIGQAITARYLDADSQSARPFVGWLKRLFQIEQA
jgi:hypothetical protein